MRRLVIPLIVLLGLRTALAILGRTGETYYSTHNDIRGFRESLYPEDNPFNLLCNPLFRLPLLVVIPCDIPFALAADSLLLPYDYYIGFKRGFFMRILDDQGAPVPRAVINGYSTQPLRGESDREGLYRWASDSRSIEWFAVSKEGYYDTTQEPRRWPTITDELVASQRNILTVVLKRVRNPTPMYAKEASVDLPSIHGSYGYDLMIGDLVNPFGKGQVADFIFAVRTVERFGRQDLDPDITFSSPTDGIQRYDAPRSGEQHRLRRSAYLFPYEAPVDGYRTSLASADAAVDAAFGEREQWENRYHNCNYLFRVRSSSVEGGLYGRIYGFFTVLRRERNIPHVEFMYFLNPSGARSLEWDSKAELTMRMARDEHRPYVK
jgi:hypothetical protein